jgi:hypothetical protein
VALLFFLMAWLVAVAVRLGRFLWAPNK